MKIGGVTFESVPCKVCGKLTPMLGTKLCDPCWSLTRAIRDNPEAARKILDEMAVKA